MYIAYTLLFIALPVVLRHGLLKLLNTTIFYNLNHVAGLIRKE